MLVKAHKYHQIFITVMRPANLLTSKPYVLYAITMHKRPYLSASVMETDRKSLCMTEPASAKLQT